MKKYLALLSILWCPFLVYAQEAVLIEGAAKGVGKGIGENLSKQVAITGTKGFVGETGVVLAPLKHEKIKYFSKEDSAPQAKPQAEPVQVKNLPLVKTKADEYPRAQEYDSERGAILRWRDANNETRLVSDLPSQKTPVKQMGEVKLVPLSALGGDLPIQEKAKALIGNTISKSSLSPQQKQNFMKFFNRTSINFESENTTNFFNDASSVLEISNLEQVKDMISALPVSSSMFARIRVHEGKLIPEVEIGQNITFSQLEDVLKDALDGASYTGQEIVQGAHGKRVRFGDHETMSLTDPDSNVILHVHVEQRADVQMFLGSSSPLAGNEIWLNTSYQLPINEDTLLDAVVNNPHAQPAFLMDELSAAEKLDFIQELSSNVRKLGDKQLEPLVSGLRQYYGAVVESETKFAGKTLDMLSEEEFAQLTKLGAQRSQALENLYIKMRSGMQPLNPVPVELEDEILRESTNAVLDPLKESYRQGATGFKATMFEKLLDKYRVNLPNLSPSDAVQKVRDALTAATQAG